MKLRKGRAAAALAVLAVILVSGVGCATKVVGGSGESSNSSEKSTVPQTTEAPTEEPTTEPVPEDKRVHVVAAGDNLIHYSVYRNAEKLAGPGENFDFKPLYENVKYIVEDADLAILNQDMLKFYQNGTLKQ